MLNGRFAQFDGAGTAFDYFEATGFGRQPYCSLVSGPLMCVAGPQGLAIGAFCWVNPDTGETSNSVSDGSLMGFVLPVENNYNLWERVFIRNGLPFPQMIIRPGVACVVASMGVFRAKFPDGGCAGARVYANPINGLPYAGVGSQFTPITMDDSLITMDNTSVTFGELNLIPTRWTLTQSGTAGSRLLMSSFVKPLNS